MSARSPQGSLSGASSSEIADDFADSLKDLHVNNKHEIINLTTIAQENTEHAQAISKAIEDHIKVTAPNRKLPALYLLDSIIKNVGTPYTLYLGSNIYHTFMEAYTLVDTITRRSMENLLKTWKEPIPGSIDPRPVFPPETVRPIENALIKARTAALQNQRQVQQPPHRSIPTPPQHNGHAPAIPNQQHHPQAPNAYTQVGLPPYPPHQPAAVSINSMPTQHAYSFGNPAQQNSNDIESIKHDLGGLIISFQSQFSNNPFDQSLRQRLQALLQLQDVLNNQRLSDGDLQTIRNQLSALSNRALSIPAKPTPPPQSVTQWQPPAPTPDLQMPPFQAPSQTYTQPQSTQPPAAAAPLFAPGALNGLQALLANNQKPGTPQMRAAAPALQHASHSQLQTVQSQAAAAPSLNGNDLLAALTKTGLVANLPVSNPPPIATLPTTTPSAAELLRSLQGILPPVPQSSNASTPPNLQAASKTKLRLPMVATSLKIFQPSLVQSLYTSLPNQCSTCGRRFPATDDGRAKKDRHLDWHFRTNQRMADPNATRGQYRRWYPDELEWVQMTEFDESTTTSLEAAEKTAAAAGPDSGFGVARRSTKPEEEVVRAPPGMTKTTCSVCFEEMKSSYHEGMQDWVFANARRQGGKIVHATCLAEMQKGHSQSFGGSASSLAAALASMGGGNQQQRQRSATPDSTLGKRKAESQLVDAGMAARVKIE